MATQTPSTKPVERRETLKLDQDLQLQLQEHSLEKITTVNTFVAQFAFAVENTWVTTLLISYATQSYIDSFMWTVPIVISIAIRPYIEIYVSKFRLSLACYIRHIILFYIGAAIGHFIVILSTYPGYLIDAKNINFMSFHFLRIFTAIIGWTTVDVCLDFVLSHSDGIKELNGKIEGADELEEDENQLTLIARLSAYGLSFLACFGAFTFRNFQLHTCLLYTVAGVMCLLGAVHTFFMNKIQIVKAQGSYKKVDNLFISFQFIKQSLSETRIAVDTYFPGFHQTLSAPLQLKMHLAISFAYNYISDTVYIYTTIWMAVTYIKSQDITAQMFIIGLRIGSLLLGGLSVAIYIVKTIYGRHVKEPATFLKGFLRITTITIAVAIFAGITMRMDALAVFVVLVGAIVGMSELYFEEKDEMLSNYFPDYSLCMGFTGTLQKLFILCPMPFYWMILMDDDDIPNCIWWATIALFVLLLLLIHQYFTLGQNPLGQSTATVKSASEQSAHLSQSLQSAKDKKNE